MIWIGTRRRFMWRGKKRGKINGGKDELAGGFLIRSPSDIALQAIDFHSFSILDMTRQTSIDAYHEVLESGLVGKRQKQVYDILYRKGPLTANQTWNILSFEIGDLRFDSNTRARFTELREFGIIQEVGEVPDPITKKRVILWDVTDKSPVKPMKKKTNREIIRELQKEIKELRRQLEERPKHRQELF